LYRVEAYHQALVEIDGFLDDDDDNTGFFSFFIYWLFYQLVWMFWFNFCARLEYNIGYHF
jgi:hypothetical protein